MLLNYILLIVECLQSYEFFPFYLCLLNIFPPLCLFCLLEGITGVVSKK